MEENEKTDVASRTAWIGEINQAKIIEMFQENIGLKRSNLC